MYPTKLSKLFYMMLIINVFIIMLSACYQQAPPPDKQYLILDDGTIFNIHTTQQINQIPLQSVYSNDFAIQHNPPRFFASYYRITDRRKPIITVYQLPTWQPEVEIEMPGYSQDGLTEIYPLPSHNLLYISQGKDVSKGGSRLWFVFFDLKTNIWITPEAYFYCGHNDLLYQQANLLYLGCSNRLGIMDLNTKTVQQTINLENPITTGTVAKDSMYLLDVKGQLWVHYLDSIDAPHLLTTMNLGPHDYSFDKKIAAINGYIYVPRNIKETSQINIVNIKTGQLAQDPIKLDYKMAYADFTTHNEDVLALIVTDPPERDDNRKLIKLNLRTQEETILFMGQMDPSFVLFALSPEIALDNNPVSSQLPPITPVTFSPTARPSTSTPSIQSTGPVQEVIIITVDENQTPTYQYLSPNNESNIALTVAPATVQLKSRPPSNPTSTPSTN